MLSKHGDDNHHGQRLATGLVSPDGAGPGDPDLVTIGAARRIAEAELILHDALVSQGVLDLAGCVKTFVGKRAGRRAFSQAQVNELMIEASRRGQRVVRLKGGDPFVLGRGGEETLALIEAGVPFEVIPGVSSAIAAPEVSGIPVTHRGLASGFVVASGHAEAAYAPILRALGPHSLTIIVLMGLATRTSIASLLLSRGWRPQTPLPSSWRPQRRTPPGGPVRSSNSPSTPGASRDDCCWGSRWACSNFQPIRSRCHRRPRATRPL